MKETYQDLEGYPKTFEELFKGTSIKPEKQADGSIQYNFKAKKMEYFTPSEQDICLGYECEINSKYVNNKDEWSPYVVGEGYENITIARALSEVKFKGIRVPYLSKEQIESQGFVLKSKSIDHWFQIAEDKRFDTDLHNFCGYKCYNVFLNYGFHDYRLKIKADFGGGCDFDKAETLFDGECKCINSLRKILKQIHITPFYGE